MGGATAARTKNMSRSIGRGTTPTFFWGGLGLPRRTQFIAFRLILMGGWRDSFAANGEKSRVRLGKQGVAVVKTCSMNVHSNVCVMQGIVLPT